ncbi:MAG TPA: hypothetical protein VGI76_06710 [Solirubrobacteraceae bacterium]|jgi:hypothetical protein
MTATEKQSADNGRGGLMGLLDRTNKVVVLLGGIGALILTAGAVIALFSDGTPHTPEAKFLEATIDPHVLLKQFEANTSTGSEVSYAPPANGTDDRIALDVAPAATPEGGKRVEATFVRATAKTASLARVSTIALGNVELSHVQAEAQAEATHAQEQGETETEHAQAQAQEEGRLGASRAAQQSIQAQRHAQSAGDQAAASAEAEGKQAQSGQQNPEASEAQIKAQAEEARVKATEAAKLKYEDQNPASSVPTEVKKPPLRREGNADVAVGTGAPKQAVAEAIRMSGVQDACLKPSCPAITSTTDKAIADYSSNLDEAARSIAETFRDSRRESVDNKTEQVGVTVDYSIDFVGYSGKRLLLEWTLCSTRGGPLHREWWRNVVVKQIKPRSDPAKVIGDFWAPVPPASGDYYFRLRVFDGLEQAGTTRTDLFH